MHRTAADRERRKRVGDAEVPNPFCLFTPRKSESVGNRTPHRALNRMEAGNIHLAVPLNNETTSSSTGKKKPNVNE